LPFPAVFLALVAILAPSPSAAALVRGSLRCAGSETMVPLLGRWASAFARLQPAATLHVVGGGSEGAVRALVAGTTDIAALSRALEPSESELLRRRFGAVRVLEVGRDTLRLLARRDGAARRQPDRAALAFRPDASGIPWRGVGRLPSSGTRHEALQMLGVRALAPRAYHLVSPVAVQLALRHDPSLVGYGSAAGLLSDVRPVGTLFLERPLTLVVPVPALGNPVVARFLTFLSSEEGRAIVRESGFAPPEGGAM
jgi:hypothetical protein